MTTLNMTIRPVGVKPDKSESDFDPLVIWSDGWLDSDSNGEVEMAVEAVVLSSVSPVTVSLSTYLSELVTVFRSFSRQTNWTAGAWLVAVAIRGGSNTGQRGRHLAKSALVTMAEYWKLVDPSPSKFVSQPHAR